jgi:hypothetical protein
LSQWRQPNARSGVPARICPTAADCMRCCLVRARVCVSRYKWSLLGWSLEYRLKYFERHWAYFLGFGAPAVTLSLVFPKFISLGIFALAFPIVRIRTVLLRAGGTASAQRSRCIEAWRLTPTPLLSASFFSSSSFWPSLLVRRRTCPSRYVWPLMRRCIRL